MDVTIGLTLLALELVTTGIAVAACCIIAKESQQPVAVWGLCYLLYLLGFAIGSSCGMFIYVIFI
jgi:hypothetical protein